MSYQVIVIGMHRSGSSLMANLLHRAGISMGERLVKGKASNIDGHFEDWEMVSINEKLLKKLDATWDHPPPVERIEALSREIKAEYSRFVSARDGCWGVKDPRLNIFLPHIDALLSSPFYLYCVRDPQEVAKSLQVREGMSLEAALELKKLYDGMCEKFLATRENFIMVDYRELVTNPEDIINRALAKLDFTPRVSLSEIVAPVRTKESLNSAKRKMLVVDIVRSVRKAITTPSLLSLSKVKSRIRQWARELISTFS